MTGLTQTGRTLAWMATIAALVWTGVACSSDDDAEPTSASGTTEVSDNEEPAATPGWRGLHAAVMKTSCAVGACHDGPKGIGGLSFETAEDSYAALVGMPPTNGAAASDGFLLVAPGEPERSFLLRKVSKDQEVLEKEAHGAPMPLGNLDRLGPNTLAALTQWIEDGAPLEGADIEPDYLPPPPAENYVQCEATEEMAMRDCFPDAADATENLRLYSPPLTIEPQADVQLCSILNEPLAEDLYLTGATGMQFPGGHHIAIYTAAAAMEPGVVPCDDIDMSALRFVVGAGGVGGLDTTLPEGIALRVPKGQQLIIQSHYINTKLEPAVVMDGVDIDLTTPDAGNALADSFAMIDSEFEIPPFTFGYERVKTCEIVQEMDIVLLIGHTHDFGVLYRLEHETAAGEKTELYYATDGPTLRDNPEVKVYEQPLRLSQGDKLHMTCQWNNDTAHPVGWPEEMCVAFTYYTPGNGWLICDTEDSSPRVLGGGDGDGCKSPGDEGNELGVGTYCTIDGTECMGNGDANFCLTNFSSKNNYCSIILCTSDEQCGEGASCVEEGPGSACVLDECEEDE